jgi:site-specific recombinase XerD
MKKIYTVLEDKTKSLTMSNQFHVLFLRNYAVFEVLYSTGMRKSELVNLKMNNIQFGPGLVEIFEGKGGKDRVVPIGKGSLDILTDYINKARPHLNPKGSDYVFLSNYGTKIGKNGVLGIVHRVMKAAGIEKNVKVHTLRHTCATHMLNHGADIRFVQELLGHTNLSSTQIYTHVSIQELLKSHSLHHPRELEGFF